jgi:gliding motility-associated-like protein
MKSPKLLILLFAAALFFACNKLDDTIEQPNNGKVIKVSGERVNVAFGNGLVLDAFSPLYANYLWKGIYSPAPYSNQSSFIPPDTGFYRVIYNKGLDSTTVFVYPPIVFYYPNTFNPNSGIGANKVWKVLLSGISDFNLCIYTLDNIKVYESNDYSTHGWDGTYKGRGCPIGNYYFVLKYTSFISKESIATGLIELMR